MNVMAATAQDPKSLTTNRTWGTPKGGPQEPIDAYVISALNRLQMKPQPQDYLLD